MDEFLQTCFAWPIFPASVLLIVVCLYWLFVILGAFDLDFIDFDMEMDGDVQGGAIAGMGLVTLRFLNLGSVPIMLWMSVFALAWWLLAMLMEGPLTEPMFAHLATVLARDIGLAVAAAKILTNPLRGRFDVAEPNPAKDLIGKTCVITTSTANQAFGRGLFETGAAPLYLNVRAQEGEIPKGESALIIDFDPEQHIYFVKSCVKSANQENV